MPTPEQSRLTLGMGKPDPERLGRSFTHIEQAVNRLPFFGTYEFNRRAPSTTTNITSTTWVRHQLTSDVDVMVARFRKFEGWTRINCRYDTSAFASANDRRVEFGFGVYRAGTTTGQLNPNAAAGRFYFGSASTRATINAEATILNIPPGVYDIWVLVQVSAATITQNTNDTHRLRVTETVPPGTVRPL